MKTISVVFSPSETLELRKMRNWIGDLIKQHGENLFRYKGIINVAGFDDKFVFQGVHQLFDGDFLAKWKDDEERVSKFVFIGKNLDEMELEKNFRECISKPLRFAVGTKVMAKVRGGFSNGVVVKHWDNGNPYRIKLDSNQREVYGPLDDDRVVRKVEEEWIETAQKFEELRDVIKAELGY